MRVLFLLVLQAALAAAAADARAALVKIVGPIDTRVTLSAANEYILEGPVLVTNGGVLTIPAGTVIRGQPRSGPVGFPAPPTTVGAPGSLFVTREGEVRAQGSATNPVIFTTAALDANGDRVADLAASGLFATVPGGCTDVLPLGGDGVCEDLILPQPFLDATPKTTPLAPLDANGNGNVKLWGGVVLLGRAPTNLAAVDGLDVGEGLLPGSPQVFSDLAEVAYGGFVPHDSSGVMQYVSIRHGGDELGFGYELNGLTLAGVGDGTRIEYVEIYAWFDDGFEWLGGTVDGRWLVSDLAGDDSFDTDQGYTGMNQFLMGLMTWFNEDDGSLYGSESGNNAFELDGDDWDDFLGGIGGPALNNANLVGPKAPIEPSPAFASPMQMNHQIFYNATIVGSAPDSGAPGTAVRAPALSPAAPNRGIRVRHGFQGEIHNAIVVNTGSGLGLNVGIGGGAPGVATAECIATDSNADGVDDLCAIVCSTFDDVAPILGGSPEAALLANGDARNPLTALDDNVFNAGFPDLLEEDHTFAPRGNASGRLDATLVGVSNPRFDPRPGAGLTGVGGCQLPPYPSIQTAAYRGAFNPSRNVPLWTTGWTVRSIAGLIAP